MGLIKGVYPNSKFGKNISITRNGTFNSNNQLHGVPCEMSYCRDTQVLLKWRGKFFDDVCVSAYINFSLNNNNYFASVDLYDGLYSGVAFYYDNITDSFMGGGVDVKFLVDISDIFYHIKLELGFQGLLTAT